ncbi:Beta-amylase 8 [Triticum urartu]|uniref:Beta-amylase n=1 Tax=Triticum urartu TaxID=4572 RepID=M7ZBJ9_TRIUA|nr:Beta-amylase 8 [Triticum urartu]
MAMMTPLREERWLTRSEVHTYTKNKWQRNDVESGCGHGPIWRDDVAVASASGAMTAARSDMNALGNDGLQAAALGEDHLQAGALGLAAGCKCSIRNGPFVSVKPTEHKGCVQGAFQATSLETPVFTNSLNSYAIGTPIDSQASALQTDDSLSPSSLDSVVVAEQSIKNESYGNSSSANSLNCMGSDQLLRASAVWAGDFTKTPYIPVYASLSMGIINCYCQLVDPEAVRAELRHLKSLNVDGVVVDCWWGIVEAWTPQKYEWSGYRDLFGIIKEFKLKVQVVLSFHGSGECGSGGVLIALPRWVIEIAQENQDIFFTDREGRRNTECLSWGIDKERVLRGRTGIEVYFDFMRSFHMEFRSLSEEGLISAIEVGLGASGELRYPSCPEKMGWRYPGIGEFQCYDRYMQKNLRQSALTRGHLFWARGPDNAGYYNSRSHETGFFCDGGDYDSYYGRFFLNWYSGILIDHVDQVLSLATLAFDGAAIVVKFPMYITSNFARNGYPLSSFFFILYSGLHFCSKQPMIAQKLIPSIYWWYRTASHAAELTAGFYNPTNRDGYSPVFRMLKKHSIILKVVCYGPEFTVQENDEAFADPEGLTWQVMNAAWDHGLSRDVCFSELETFVKCMHGEATQNFVD